MSTRLIALAATSRVQLRAQPADTAAAPVTVGGMVVPWGQEFQRMGGVRFVFTRDSLRLPDDLSTVKLLVQHDDDRPIGYALTAAADDTGLHMTFALPDHPRTAAAVAELDARLRDGASVGIEVDADVVDQAFDAWWDDEQTEPIVMAGLLREVSQVTVPQFNDARVSRHRAPALLTLAADKETPMAESTVLPTVELAAERFRVEETPEFLELAHRVTQLEAGTPGAGHPLARYATLGDLIRAGLDDDGGRVALALADNVTANNPGVIPPAWLSQVRGIIERRRTAVEAFGLQGLPESGMDVSWPYYDGDLSTLVGEQATQKTDIVSARVDIKKGTSGIKTYAGGADNALQLIERSSPAYLELWGRIMLAAYAVVTERAFSTAVAAAAAGTAVLAPGTATAAQIRAFLFEASDKVDDATGAPASFALVAGDVFRAWGAVDGLHNPDYGTQNAEGTASARTLEINVNGLPVLKGRGLADGTVLVSNGDAAAWMEDGPSFIDALNVSKLGRDSAVYGFGTTAVFAPTGIVKAVATLTARTAK